jgi:hypothetical protein
MKTPATKSAPARATKPAASRKPAGKAKLTLKRELKSAVAVLAEGLGTVRLTALPQAVVLPVESGRIKLETSSMSPGTMLDTLTTIGTGMAATAAYASLPVLTDVNGARTALSTVIVNMQNLEIQLRENRILLGQWMTACGNTLNALPWPAKMRTVIR